MFSITSPATTVFGSRQFLGMEFCNGNYVALLAAPERLFASSDAKRARLHKLVVAACLDSLSMSSEEM